MAFEKGQSGNPGGRPKEDSEVKALARQYGREAVEKLADLMRNADDRTAAAAANALLDRGFGKPAQVIAGDAENPIAIREILIRAVDATANRPAKEG